MGPENVFTGPVALLHCCCSVTPGKPCMTPKMPIWSYEIVLLKGEIERLENNKKEKLKG